MPLDPKTKRSADDAYQELTRLRRRLDHLRDKAYNSAQDTARALRESADNMESEARSLHVEMVACLEEMDQVILTVSAIK